MASNASSPSSFAEFGAAHFSAVLRDEELGMIEAGIGEGRRAAAGTRFRSLPALRPLLSAKGGIGSIATSLIGSKCQPVRTILFDKNRAVNWGLDYHQDRTIAVVDRADVKGFGHWTVKDGMIHVEPPFAFLADMITLRVHLDPVDATNAPLLIAPGSHRLGRLTEAQIAETVASCGTFACHAGRGDIWAYATPIVHGSARVTSPKGRRVLQIDYSAQRLPEPLRWLGL